jgi:microcystin-dependent protein
MSEPFLGQIILVPYNFAPRGWAFCNGQILPISQNTALFSLLGTTFGGNGQTTFALPDLRGRVPNGSGQGPGPSNYDLGQVAGTETVTLTVNQMPMHNHLVNVNSGDGTGARVENTFLSNSGTELLYDSAQTTAGTMAPQMISNAGGNQPLETLQPYLTLNYCIALEGIFPSRN